MSQQSSSAEAAAAKSTTSASVAADKALTRKSPSAEGRLSATMWAAWRMLFDGADPGHYRLMSASRTVLGLGIAFAANGLFVHLVHPLDLNAAAGVPQAVVRSANHGLLVLALSLGAIQVLTTSNSPPTMRVSQHLRTMVIAVALSLGSFTVGVSLGGHRIASFAVLVVLLAGAAFVARFGPSWASLAPLAFAFELSGFFSHGLVSLDKLGWCAAFITVGAAAEVIVRYVLLRPNPRRSLRRTQNSFDARATKVSRLALTLFDDPGNNARDRRRLGLALSRMNEAALMIDAQLGLPRALPPEVSPAIAQQRLFDVELALNTCARLAPLMVHPDISDAERDESRRALVAIADNDLDAAVNHAESLTSSLRTVPGRFDLTDESPAAATLLRFASAVDILAETRRAWDTLGQADAATGEFRPATTLVTGSLPGAAGVTATASRESGWRRDERVRLAASTRLAIQVTVAATAAISLGDLVSGRRFYWALIAVFVVFLGTSHSGAQVRKAVLRVVGTAVGIVVGSGLAQAIGGTDPAATIAVILVALFAALYLIKINYTFMVIGITVTLTQLYEQLGEFSNSMLKVRLEEQALGAAIALIVVILVLPMRTNRVLRIGLRHHLEAVAVVLERATTVLLGGGTRDAVQLQLLRNDARAVDVSYHSLGAITAPVRRTSFGGVDDNVETLMRDASATQRYCADLVADAGAANRLAPGMIATLEPAVAGMRSSLNELTRGLTDRRQREYDNSSVDFDRVERELEHVGGNAATRLAVRDLSYLDAALTNLADTSDRAFALAKRKSHSDAAS